MNMKKLIAVGTLLPFAALAEEPVVVTETQAKEANADVAVEITASESMQQMFDNFAKKKGKDFAFGVRSKTGVIYFCEQSRVASKPVSNKFIQDRQNAFDDAFNKILANHISRRTGEIITKNVQTLYADDSSDVLDTPKSLEEASKGVLKKIKVAGEALIDKGLRSLGVDPSKYDGKPAEEKRVIYAKTMMRESTVRALGSVSGVTVVKTLEAHSADGKYVIGVIAKYDPMVEEVARCIAREVHPNIALKKGIPAASLVKQPAEKLVQNFGVRFIYNENGKPELVAFAQWASAYSGTNDYIADEMMRTAKDHARNAADQMVAEFVGGCYANEEKSTRGRQIEEANVFDENGGVRTENIDKLVSVYRQSSKVTGRLKMHGTDPIATPSFIKHPCGSKVAISAVRYSFDVLDEAKTDYRKKAQEEKVAAPKNEAEGTAGTAEGDETDF